MIGHHEIPLELKGFGINSLVFLKDIMVLWYYGLNLRYVCHVFGFLMLLVSQVLEAMNAAADGQPALSILEQTLQMEPPAPCLWVNEGELRIKHCGTIDKWM